MSRKDKWPRYDLGDIDDKFDELDDAADRTDSWPGDEDGYQMGDWPSSRPIPVEDGIRATSVRGRIGDTWWSQRWLESLGMSGVAGDRGGRLSRGKNYARRGQVVQIDVTPGKVEAIVQGSRAEPYEVAIRVAKLSTRQWNKAMSLMAERSAPLAQLLAGKMPHDVEAPLEEAGISLFPDGPDDVSMKCTCPDWSSPCKHCAAVAFLVAEQMDRDPFLLFTLRGRTREQIIDGLRDARSKLPGPGAAAPRGRDDAAEDEAVSTGRDVKPGGRGQVIEELPSISCRIAEFWDLKWEEPLQAVIPDNDLSVHHDPTTTLRSLGAPPFGEGSQGLIDILSRGYLEVSLAARLRTRARIR